MSTQILRRLLTLLPVLVVVGTVVFLLGHLIPGDPAGVMAGDHATAKQIERIRKAMGLDRPLPVQFWEWVRRVLRGDLGTSFFLKQPVGEAMIQRLEPTGLLTLSALLVSLIIGLPAGIVAAVRRNSMADRLTMLVSLAGICIPTFWLAIMLVLVFAATLRLLPAVGYIPLDEGPLRTLRSLLMPAFALGVSHGAFLTRVVRSSVLDVLHEDYVQTARAKGLSERQVLMRHVLPNVLVPILTVIGNSMGGLMSGAVTTEIVFNMPGVGRLMINSIARRDYPVIQGVVLCGAVIYVVVNLAVDIAYTIVDPRIREATR
jgi:peptide/nickel transport system permease protein